MEANRLPCNWKKDSAFKDLKKIPNSVRNHASSKNIVCIKFLIVSSKIQVSIGNYQPKTTWKIV